MNQMTDITIAIDIAAQTYVTDSEENVPRGFPA
jgi:hypothetical protein